MNRYWINQPSSLQPQHDYHGRLVLANPEVARDGGTVYLTDHDDPAYSMEVCANVLSEGWPIHLRRNTKRRKTAPKLVLDNDHMKMYMCSMGKVFRVTHICDSVEEANRTMEANKDMALIAEDRDGHLFLALQYGSVAPSAIMDDMRRGGVDVFQRYIYRKTEIGYNVIDTFHGSDERPHVIISFENSPKHNAEFLARDFCRRHNAKER